MAATTSTTTAISPLDALWTLFQELPKASRKAFTERILEEDVRAEIMRRKLFVKQSLTQAFTELHEAKTSGRQLPDARHLFD